MLFNEVKQLPKAWGFIISRGNINNWKFCDGLSFVICMSLVTIYKVTQQENI